MHRTTSCGTSRLSLGAQGVAPLVWGEADRSGALVADVAAVQPSVEREPVGGSAGRCATVGVLRGPGEQQHGRRGSARISAWSSTSIGTSASRFILWLK